MIGWLDCGAGASGDMFLGALVDAGVPVEHLQSVVDSLPVERVPLSAERTSRHAIAATRVRVAAGESHHHRTWRDVRAIVTGADLPPAVRDGALDAFARLAAAEAAVHGTTPDEVHFHEVGALDAIADIVGTCAGIDWLRTHRGLTGLSAGTLTLGGGRARGAHGAIPVPGPAVLGITAAADIPVTGGDLPYEACTPTGAALLATHVTTWGSLPPMRVRTVGVGAGGRDPDETANVLRLVLGDPLPTRAEGAVVVECNVDDLDPRLWPAVLAKLLSAGAADAWLTPILMKKGRPAHTLHVLCRPNLADAVRAVVFAETSSIGLRVQHVDKYPLDRAGGVVTVDGREIRVKVARDGDAVVNVSVEYDDVVAAAEALGVPAKLVLARASAAAQDLHR
ncbi:MAG TPA: nickel pincer cofactor biosynthesis protein LarC [Actinocatenispora sp.]